MILYVVAWRCTLFRKIRGSRLLLYLFDLLLPPRLRLIVFTYDQILNVATTLLLKRLLSGEAQVGQLEGD